MKLTFLLLLLTSLAFGQTPVDQARTLFESKRYDDAKKVLLKIQESDKSYGQAQYYLGRIAIVQKDLDAAEDYLEEAIDTNDKIADYHFWLGNALGMAAQEANMVRQGMLATRIREEFEKTVALKEDHLDAHWGLITFYTAAPGFMGGSFEKARAQAKVIAKYSEADGHRALAVIYNKEEKFAEAEKEYLAAWKVNPSYSAYLVNFYTNRKEYEKAFTFLENQLKTEPENFGLIYQIGKTSAISGQRLDRGLECLTRYLAHQPKENEPSHAGANMRIGQIQEKKGNKPEAKKYYEIAVRQEPTLKDAKEGLARVSK